MATKRPQKGEQLPTRRLVADIPEELYLEVKFRSVETRTDMKDIVAEALRRYLAEERKGGTRRHSPLT
jgi:hypothetical protein